MKLIILLLKEIIFYLQNCDKLTCGNVRREFNESTITDNAVKHKHVINWDEANIMDNDIGPDA